MSQGDSSQHPSTQQNRPAEDPSDMDLDSIAKLYADDFDDFAKSDEVSLEELSKSYAQTVGRRKSTETVVADADAEIQFFDPLEDETNGETHIPVSPITIIEAVLMVGRPDGGAISATEIAALMRGVSEAEVDQLIEQLNRDYETNHRAIRVAMIGGAYRLELANDLQHIKDRFMGPAREIKLNQAAIDCLALVAYQPGITRQKLDEQRGTSSGAVLNQLVRRELLEMRREMEDNKLQPHYYPTDRMLDLVGLESLEDLPMVEDWNG